MSVLSSAGQPVQTVAARLRARTALAGAGAGVASLALTWLLAFRVATTRNADQVALRGFFNLRSVHAVAPISKFLIALCSPVPYVYIAAVPVFVALVARRRGVLGMTIAVILAGANLTTHLLKPLFSHTAASPSDPSPLVPTSWPSGHATAAMSLALCTLMAVPETLRFSAAALGAAFALAVSYSFLMLGYHYPSDVVGGYLVAVTWTMVGLSAMSAIEISSGRSRGIESERCGSPWRAVGAPVAAVSLVVAVAAAAVARGLPPWLITLPQEAVFMVGSATINLLALSAAAGSMLILRRYPS